MKFGKDSETFSFIWDQVVAAVLKKYPNPFSPHIISEDVIHREVTNQTLYTKKIIKKVQGKPIPSFLRGVVHWATRGRDTCFVVEESMVDLDTKICTTYTRNVEMRSFSVIVEKCVYRPDSGDALKTQVDRMHWVSARFQKLGSEKFLFNRCKSRIADTNSGIEYVARSLFAPDTLHEMETASHKIDKGLLKKNFEKMNEVKEKAKEKVKINKEKVKGKLITHAKEDA